MTPQQVLLQLLLLLQQQMLPWPLQLQHLRGPPPYSILPWGDSAGLRGPDPVLQLQQQRQQQQQQQQKQKQQQQQLQE